MPNLTTVGLTAGAATSGTGTVSTLDNVVGVAGTPSAQVQTVQGITSMTALKIDGSAVTQPVSGSVTVSGTVTANSTLAAETTKVIGVTRTADGSGNLLTSTANALDINIKSGGNNNGATTASASAPVTPPTDGAPITVAVTPTITAASAYTAGNEVGGLMTFTNVGRAPGTSGIVQDVTLTVKTVQTVEFDLYLFNANPTNTTWTDKTAPAINAADVFGLIGIVKLTKNYSGLGTHTIYKPDETTFAPIPFSGANLYGVLVTLGTPTFGTTSGVSVTLGVI